MIPVRAIMHRDPLVTATPEMSIRDLNAMLARHKISGVPVIDSGGKCVGVVSQTDIVETIADDLKPQVGFYYSLPPCLTSERDVDRDLHERNVETIMERKVHWVHPDDDVSTAAKIMRNLKVHRLLVLRDGTLVGMVSAFDLLQVLEKPRLSSFLKEVGNISL